MLKRRYIKKKVQKILKNKIKYIQHFSKTMLYYNLIIIPFGTHAINSHRCTLCSLFGPPNPHHCANIFPPPCHHFFHHRIAGSALSHQRTKPSSVHHQSDEDALLEPLEISPSELYKLLVKVFLFAY